MCCMLMKAGLQGCTPCLPLVAAPMGIAAARADMAYLVQQQNVMATTQLASVEPPMGMEMANPVWCRSINSETHWSKPKLTDTNCHEP
jgi:hypothetical protein